MPFQKKGKYYYSPSGRKYTPAQVRLYYANNGFPKKKKKRKARGLKRNYNSSMYK